MQGGGGWVPVERAPWVEDPEAGDNGSPAGGRSVPGLRIALLAGPMVAVPPPAYGGTERIVAALATSLTRRGHDVTVYASGDSTVEATLRPVTERALWQSGYRGDVAAPLLRAVARCWADARHFDLIHSHVEAFGFLFARYASVPVVSTLHGRLDGSGMPDLIAEFQDIPLVAISESQRRWAPDANWVGVVHNGLPLEHVPASSVVEDYLVFVGRAIREKGIAEAVELAERVGLPLKIGAKVHNALERETFEAIVQPAVAAGRVEFLGELPAGVRDPLMAAARATLMLGAWPEPFGLVAIESLATGTPVIARRAGALPEIVEHGVDGFLVDDLAEAELAVRLVDRLDRKVIRRRALERFSAERMAQRYEAIYQAVLEDSPAQSQPALPARVLQRAGA